MSSIESSSKNVPLQTVEGWDQWDEEFQTKAISLHLWEFINPESDGSPMDKPDRPEVGAYHRRIPPWTKDTEHLLQQGRQTRQIEVTDPNHRARNLSELTAEDKASFSFEWRVYEQNYREYKVQETNCDKLKQWVTETVDYSLRKSSCRPMWDLRTWYTNLKTSVGASEREQERAARRNYEQATRILTNVPTDFEGWITRWEMATNHALMRKTRGVEDPNTWFEDLTKAIQLVLGNWETIYAGIYKDKLEEKTLTIREVAKDLRREVERRKYLSLQEKSTKITKGELGSTFDEETDLTTHPNVEEDGSNTSPLPKTRGGSLKRKFSRAQSSKRKRAATSNETGFICKACVVNHLLDERQ